MNSPENSVPTADGSNETRAKLTLAISRGMHALAQPLTAALGGLEITLLNSHSLDEFRSGAESALVELERATQLLTYVRQLIHVQTPAEDIVSFSLAGLLEELIEDMRRTYEASAVRLVLCRCSGDAGVRMSLSRARQMLFCLLQGVRANCPSGATARINVKQEDRQVLLRIDLAPGSKVLPAEQGADIVMDRAVENAFALAEAIVISSQGQFLVIPAPFSVKISLPAATLMMRNGGREADSAAGQNTL
jgi:K+-sensing histidine kinase KdpD